MNFLEEGITQDIAFLNADPNTTWWYNGETIKFRSPRTVVLLSHIQQNPRATIAELSSALEINTAAVRKQLSTLESKGYITKDPDSKAWRVIAVPTTKQGGKFHISGTISTGSNHRLKTYFDILEGRQDIRHCILLFV